MASPCSAARRYHATASGILWHADALGVHPPEVVLRRGVTLLGGAAVPPDRFGGIRWHAETLGVHPPEVVLRARVALLGGAAVPRDRFGDIRWHADAGDMNAAEDELRLGVARLGAGAEVCKGLCGWPVFILCLNTGRTAHREDEGGNHEGAAHKVATHYVYSKALADEALCSRPVMLSATARTNIRAVHNFFALRAVPTGSPPSPPHTSGKNQTAGVDGCTRCHDSLLRHASHASRAIVTPRPLREARDRQLRQTVPGSREIGRVLRALPRHPVATRSGEFGREKAESGREPGRPEDATAWRFTRTR